VQVLPIVHRELRVAARQPKTWWRRVIVMGVGLVVFAFAYLTLRQWAAFNLIGRQLFSTLSVLGMIYCLLGGPLVTSDCLAKERREGTLGLLFLTDLRSYDVVFGKIAAASLNLVLDLASVLPLVALPFLMGGLSLKQFWWVALTLGNILFLSLAMGAWASTLFTSARASLGFTLGMMIFLSVGVPMLGEISHLGRGSLEPWFYSICPAYALRLCFEFMFSSRALSWSLLLNVGATQVMAWLCILGACRRTKFAWQEASSPSLSRRRERFMRWRRAKPRRRVAWRDLMLERNPIAWLEGRDLLQERLLWAMCLAACILLAVVHLQYPNDWPSADWMVIWALWTHYILCIWVAIQAPRRLGDDKSSGALELLLCTPLSTREIVRGNLQLLRRRFGRALIVLMGLDVFLLYAFFSNHGGWEKFSSGADGLLYVACCGAVVFPLQIGSLARVGIYQGLVHPNSSRATFMLLWKLAVLPLLLFVGFMIGWEYARPRLKLGNMTDWGGFCVWTGAHVLVFAVFQIHATCQLRRNFRFFAASTVRKNWWQQFLELKNRFRPGPAFDRNPGTVRPML
jgi:ABC-type transport system involved in cytochrome c biogenesis permease component